MKYFFFKLCTGYLFVLIFCVLELVPWTLLLNVKMHLGLVILSLICTLQQKFYKKIFN